MRLGAADLRAILDFIDEIGAAPTGEAFAERVLAGLHRLISCDFIAYNEVNPQIGRALVVTNPPEVNFDGATEIFAEHMTDNPLIDYSIETRDPTPLRMSDFISRPALHGTGLYHELYRTLETEYLLVVNLQAPPTFLIGISHHRSRTDFSDRDRSVLELLRPHLIRAHTASIATETMTSLDRALEAGSSAVVVLNRTSRVEHATVKAARLLETYFGRPAYVTGLPTELERWVDSLAGQGVGGDELLVRHNGSALRVRPLWRANGRVAALALDEEGSRLSQASLARFGITKRETEVLALVAEGKTNREVAAALSVTPRTVKKHLERTYDKLGVHTRTAAAAKAYEATQAGA